MPKLQQAHCTILLIIMQFGFINLQMQTVGSVYLFSPFAFEGGGCRTVWLSSISTTHFVFSSISVERSFVGKVKQSAGV